MEKYKDKNQKIEDRVEDLLSRMTLDEKAAQLCGDLPASFISEGEADLEALRSKFPNGHGRFTQYSLAGIADPMQIAKISNQVQKYFIEETRLGIPVALQTENLCGYPAAGGTLFPSMINLGSTWMPELAAEMSKIIGEESRAVGINSAMSPVIDVSRDPRWGRTYETFGEDSYLISQMGINYIKGMQSDKTDGVACIAKHFLGYSETQGGLNTAVTRVNDRELYEVFATPFEAAFKEADVSGMMASYSEINGMPVGANKDISRKLLRDTMGFQGMLTSDGAGILKMHNYFHVTKTYKEAGLLAKKGGLDTEIPIGGAYSQLPDYVREGILDEALIDESVRRILRIKFEYGLFENPYVDLDKVRESMVNESKKKLAEAIAEKSLILLKNEGVLPLKKGTKVAVVGPHSDSLRYPVSGYTYPAYIEMLDAGRKGNASVTFNGMADEAEKAKSDSKESAPPNPFSAMFDMLSASGREKLLDMNSVLKKMGSRSLVEEMRERFIVSWAQGCSITGDDISGFEDAVRAAETSDVVVMACGGNCGWVNVTGGEGKDRCRLDLPGVQQQLLEKLVGTGKPVILVLYGPGAFSLPWATDNTAAIVQAWMPGVSAGKAVADILDGTVNPGGKLPVTIPRSVGQIPVNYNHRMGSGYASSGDSAYAAIFSGGYVDEDSKPLYPFGFGLSYTKFKLSDLNVESKSIPTDGIIKLACSISNTGYVRGDEVIQVYYHFKDAKVIRPVKQLAAFQRITLESGETKRVEFVIDTALLGYYNEDMLFCVEPGAMDIMVGTSAHDIVFTEEITLTGNTVGLSGRRKYSSQSEIVM